MQPLDIDFADLVDIYFEEDIIDDVETPGGHGLIKCSFVFLHDDGNHYRGEFYRSENEGVAQYMGHECYRVKANQVVTVEWVAA